MSIKKIAREIFLIFIILTLYFLNLSRYGSNDDPAMMLTTAGIMYSNYSSETIYISNILGSLIKFLYINFPAFAWYGLVLTFIQFLSISTILKLIDEIDVNIKKTAFTKLILISCFIYFLLTVQFTHVSIISAGVGTLFLLFSNNRIHSAWGVFMILLGVLMRKDGGIYGVLLSIILTIPILISQYQQSKFFYQYIVKALISVVFLLFSVYLFNLFWGISSASLDESTKEFIEFDLIRGLIHGFNYAVTPYAFEIAEKYGLTRNDWDLFLSWSFSNRETYSTLNLKNIHNEISKDNVLSAFNISKFFLMLKDLIAFFANKFFYSYLLIFIVPTLYYYFKLIKFEFYIKKNSNNNFSLLILSIGYALIISLMILNYINNLIILIIIGCTFLIFVFYKFKIYMASNFKIFAFIFLQFFLFILIISYLYVYARMPNHVLLPSGYILLIVAILSSIIIQNKNPNQYEKTNKLTHSKCENNFSIIIILVLIELLIARKLINNINDKPFFGDFNANKYIVAFPDYYSPRFDLPVFTTKEEIPNLLKKIIPLGTNIRSPNFNNFLIKNNFSSDLLLEAACGKMYIGTNYDESLNKVNIYLNEHYNLQPKFVKIFQDQHGGIYEIQSECNE